MTILHVRVKDAKTGQTLFAEYVEIPAEESPENVIQAGLAEAFLNYGMKKHKTRELTLTKDRLISLYCREEKSTYEIARTLGGTSAESVARFLKKNGITLRSPGKHAVSHPPELRAQVVSYYSEKRLTIGEIREDTGLSEYQVRRILSEEGIVPRIGRPPKVRHG